MNASGEVIAQGRKALAGPMLSKGKGFCALTLDGHRPSSAATDRRSQTWLAIF